MTLIGYLLMISGWLLSASALFLLPGLGERFLFVFAGLLVEVLGLTLLAIRYRAMQRGPA